MPIVRNNERSETIKIISHINTFLRDKSLCVVSAGGESTISDGQQHMFPDVILYGDERQTKILQGWEVKMPDVPINDPDFIKDAQRKALTLGLNSCFIWNFTAGVLFERNSDNGFSEVHRWNDTCHIRTRQDVDTYRKDWHRTIECILLEINNYFDRGVFRSADIGEIVPDTVQSEIISRNKGCLADSLKRAGMRDSSIHAKICRWWELVKAEYVTDEPDAYMAYARILLLNWANRILFAHLIKTYHNAARSIESLCFDSTPNEANMLFEAICKDCDYYNIFVPLEYNELLPADTWRDLMELNAFLAGNAISSFNQSALQTVLERTVSASKRELVGQFTTPAKLAEVLAAISVRDVTGACIDPCCGTGSIAQALLSYKMQRGISIHDAFGTVWASDKFSFPLQIASISMARIDAINQPLRLFQCNAFNLPQIEAVEIVDPANGMSATYCLPRFKTIVSNLPFVPFEIISGDEAQFIDSVVQRIKCATRINLGDRSDLYQYLILSLNDSLVAGGQAGFITSNSWLGTKAGKSFFDSLGYYYYIEQIHISGNGRWFHNADIVTVLLILTKKDRPTKPAPQDLTRFCIWQKPLQTMNSEDLSTLITDTLLGESIHPDIIQMNEYTSDEIADLANLNISLNALFHNVKWLVRLSDKLCPVTKYLTVARGERRGWDKMFYPATGHGIEQQYIRKVLKSSRQLYFLHAVPDSDAFCCSDSIAQLESRECHGALHWIRSFENELNGVGKPLPVVLSRSNMYWYEMKDTNTAQFVTGMNPDRRLFFSKLDEPTFVNQRLIAFRQNGTAMDESIIHALLNSILGMFYIEAIGFGRGLGVLDINTTNIGNMRMLDPALLSLDARQSILNKFAALINRRVMSVEDELEQPDRTEFDHAVLTAFGIDYLYDSIKNALVSMQRVRHSVRS